MKKNLKLIGLATALFAVSAMNLKVVLNTEHSGDWSMISLAAIGEGGTGTEDGEGGFPTDPFPGQGRDAFQKVTSNYYEYSYDFLYSIGNDYYYQEYQYPVTEISCPETGKVKCNNSYMIGSPTETGIVKNPRR